MVVRYEESRRYIGNFLVVTRMRPDQDERGDSDGDELLSDEELIINKSNFKQAISTRARSGKSPADGDASGEQSMDAFKMANDRWTVADDACEKWSTRGDVAMDPKDLKRAFESARASQKKEQSFSAHERSERAASCREAKSYTQDDINNWLRKVRARKNKRGEPLLKEAQLAVLEKVAHRLGVEIEQDAAGKVWEDPLIWCVHGGPGVGKSTVMILLKELFTDVCGWDMGLQYQMAALQAVMAEQLGGDTLHHACGLGRISPAGSTEATTQKASKVAERILQWRWLIVDEISMVSSKLLAEIDSKLRDLVRRNNALKTDKEGSDYVFGGLNVIFCKDFWQLDPPDGGFLAKIPVDFIKRARRYAPAPTVAHGQAIFWGDGDGCVQGVTELTECVRTEDDWLYSLQEEIREGKMSEDNWHFLHGRPTKVPGSWINGKCACACDNCEKLVGSPHVMAEECDVCKEDRRSRHRVQNDPHDDRHLEEKFIRAPCIFPNNDIKFDVNKRRAMLFAAATGQRITWSQAKDYPSSKVLGEQPDISEAKEVWLTRHDRDCAALYGMLPLVVGLPVTLTDHIDRNQEKNLLRGRQGTIDSWVLADGEASVFKDGRRILHSPPSVVLVQFFDWIENSEGDRVQVPSSWVIEGIGRPGVYPIRPWKRGWFLDQGRVRPVLEVKRYQAPLAPAYAMTDHGAQGRTLVAAIIDLCLGRGVNIIASYVAMTRVRCRADLLIFRQFDQQIFTQGGPEGPALLLKKLRGDKIDWAAIEEKHMPRRACKGPCGLVRVKDEFSAKEWGNHLDRHCRVCMQRRSDAGTPNRCQKCRSWCSKSSFATSSLSHAANQHICESCTGILRSCSKCDQLKMRTQFSGPQWSANPETRECMECQSSRACSTCHVRKRKHEFVASHWDWGANKRNCIECMGRQRRKCSICGVSKAREAFPQEAWDADCENRTCNKCITRICSMCKKPKVKTLFKLTEWTKEVDSRCLECTSGPRQVGSWTCRGKCRSQKPISDFKMCVAQFSKPKGNSVRCDVCIRAQLAAERAISKQNVTKVMKVLPRK